MAPSITPCLWFDDNLEEAIHFYEKVFPDFELHSENRNGEGAPNAPTGLFVAEFSLNGQRFMALNGGPMFVFNESVSFSISCESQDEIDFYWNALTADGGQESQCGWVKDKFGLSWQVNSTLLLQYQADPEKDRAKRVMGAMLQMKKLDIAKLTAAYEGVET